MESRVASHFVRAEDVLDAIGSNSRDAGKSEISSYLDEMSAAAAMLIDRDLHVAAINPLGASLLSGAVGMNLSDLPILQDDVTSLLKHIGTLQNEPDETNAIIRVRRQKSERLIVFQLRALLANDGEHYVVAITSDIHWPQSYGETLTNAFALSKAESDIVRLIVDCNCVTGIAKMRGRSVGTVRNQIKSILAKTGSRNQIELVRLVMSVMALTPTSDEPEADKTLPRILVADEIPPAEQRFATGSDGRRLEYLILGDPNCAPVLVPAHGVGPFPAALVH